MKFPRIRRVSAKDSQLGGNCYNLATQRGFKDKGETMRQFLVACVLAIMVSVTAAQEAIVTRVMSIDATGAMPLSAFSFSGGFLPDDPLGMLQQEQIQEELELSNDQIAVVKELQSDIKRQTGEIFAAQAKFGGDAGKMMAAATKAIRQNLEKELKEILSPSQIKRLGQLEIQMKIKNRGAMALVDDKLVKMLGVSDEQQKEVQARHREMQKELRDEIQKLRDRYRKELIKELLSDDQLSKLEDVSGNEYEVKQINPRRGRAFLGE